ncbi:hypothetical protein [Streptomyces sp. NPDC058280]|uniref:hypothetical protein n=1 Tax=Streptomyces sp. NPDC058280 TaxID=3346419 RepID=UPI0036F0D8F5
MSDEPRTWTYRGPAELVGSPTHGADRTPVEVDLCIEMERDSVDSVLPPLKSWSGTGRLSAEYRGAPPVGTFALVLPDGRAGDVYVNASSEDGDVSLSVQGVGAPPWLTA